MPSAKLSVLVPTYNCEIHLRACLESIKWADEIVICDSFSKDHTLEIAREYTDRIIQHEYINSAKQKNWAIPQVSHEWILIIDSDELLEPILQSEIQKLLLDIPENLDGFRIPRKNLVFGKWIKSCNAYPDYNTRLFRRDLGRYEDKEVHADVLLSRLGTLQGHFIHHDFEDIEDQVRKWARYIRYEGDQMHKVGRSYRWYNLAFRPPIVFLYFYFWTGAFREGFRGFYTAMMWSYYVFLKHARTWQLEWQNSEEGKKYWEMDQYET
jgi:glycosyltransferase involved in cell wall biosynthesis